MPKHQSGLIRSSLFAFTVFLLAVACKPDPPLAERRFEDLSVPQSFGWSQIRNLVISVNMSGGEGQVFDLLDNQNRRIDRQLIREGRAVFNVRMKAETPFLKVKSPVTGQEISFPSENTTINFNLDSVAALVWYTAVDSDGDSIPDNWDDFPNNPQLAFSRKLPYAGSHYVLFDEGWPSIGDYDFNDVVLAHQFELYYDAKRILRSGKGKLKVIAHSLGADYGLGVEYMRTVAGTTFDYAFDQTILFTSGIDTSLEKDFNTIRFFNSFSDWMGVPYSNNGVGPTATPQEIEYTFDWNANIGGNFLWPNFFLFKTNDRSFELHAFGYPPTRLANMNNLSTGDDASIRRWNWSTNFTFPNAFYRSYKNLPWGIEFFDESFAVTKEGFQLSQAYPFVVRWAETGGFSNRSWLQFPDNSRIFRLPLVDHTKYGSHSLVDMFRMIKLLPLLGFWLLTTLAQAQGGQDFQLGIQYFQQGEYEKAVTVFEELHKKEPFVNTYYIYLFGSYVQLKEYDALEKLSKAQAKRDPAVIAYKVDEAYVQKLQGNMRKAEGGYQKLIKDLSANRGAIMALTNAFRSRNEFDYAIETLLAGRRLLDSPYDFPLDLADLYAAVGKKREMAQSYLEYVLLQPQQIAYVQNMLQSRLGESDYPALRDLLLEGLQQRPDEVVLSELLIWFFVQQQDFNGAFVQARALDKRNRENGIRIMQLAASAIENKEYGAAAAMYRYIIDKKEGNAFYLEARFKLLQCSQLELEQQAAPERASWQNLANAYNAYIRDFPLFPNLPEVKQALAAVWAFQLTEIDSAMLLLEATLDVGRGDQRMLAAVKLDLGDIYLIAGEIWDASLMYAQVEKDFANEPLGQEAKFRNARLSFYKGEFDWAQAQLDVLKASTTQRISNDAIALSLLITENYDMDTVTYPMEMFARGDLWAFCRQYDKALAAYDSVLQQYPGHALTDELLFRQAGILVKRGKIDEAAALYTRILAEFGTDIYGDDALFQLARLTEYEKGDPATAMTLYQRLLNDYPDSHFVFEARRRFRSLRGDTIN